MEIEPPIKTPKRIRYRWPWFVAAFILAAIILACLWMSGEIEKTRRIRDANAPASNNAR
jgi:hypothetical protein